MEPIVNKYTLPDAAILYSPDEYSYKVWQPDKLYAVLGRANNIDDSLITGNITKDNVSVLKRPSGGEAVILSPGMLVISAKMKFHKEMNTKQIFNRINTLLIDRLSALGIKGLHSQGISDLSINDRKILGSSMYLSKDVIFYHAVLNISEDVSLISKYLKHPTREPDYRKGRSHLEFVTSIHKEGYPLTSRELSSVLTLALQQIPLSI